jgi:hypothetical protein
MPRRPITPPDPPDPIDTAQSAREPVREVPEAGVPRTRHSLVRHEHTLGPVSTPMTELFKNKPGHDQRLRGAAIRVQALKPLFLNNQRIRAGEVFTLTDPRKFKAGQMMEVTDEHPAKATQDFQPDPFPFPKVAAVKRGIPGMPRTAQGTKPTLDARKGLDQPEPEAEAEGEPTVLE